LPVRHWDFPNADGGITTWTARRPRAGADQAKFPRHPAPGHRGRPTPSRGPRRTFPARRRTPARRWGRTSSGPSPIGSRVGWESTPSGSPVCRRPTRSSSADGMWSRSRRPV